jgi:hypothetical protein
MSANDTPVIPPEPSESARNGRPNSETVESGLEWPETVARNYGAEILHNVLQEIDPLLYDRDLADLVAEILHGQGWMFVLLAECPDMSDIINQVTELIDAMIDHECTSQGNCGNSVGLHGADYAEALHTAGLLATPLTDRQQELIALGEMMEKHNAEVESWVDENAAETIANIRAAVTNDRRLIALGEAVEELRLKLKADEASTSTSRDHDWWVIRECVDDLYAAAERSREA